MVNEKERRRMRQHRMFEEISPDHLDAVIDTWIRGRNAERNRQILKDRYNLGISFEALAEKHGLCVRQTKEIIYRCELIICDKL